MRTSPCEQKRLHLSSYTCRSSNSCWWLGRTNDCVSSKLCRISLMTCTLRPLECRTTGCSLKWATTARCWKVLRMLEMCGGKSVGLPQRPVTTKALGRQAAISRVQSNAAVSTADLAQCISVNGSTLPIYNNVSKETRRKVADAMAGNVHSATDFKFEPKAYSLLPDESTSSNAAAPVAPNTIPNTMPNMVLPRVPTVNSNALPVAQPVYPLHHPFPLGMGGYSFQVALPVALPVFFPNFFPNVQGNVPVNVPVNVSVNAPAPRQFAPAPAVGFRFDPEDDMPLTQVCDCQVPSIVVNEPPTETNTQTTAVDRCPRDEHSGPDELPRSPVRPSRNRNNTRQSDFVYTFAFEGPRHELKHEPEPKPKRRRAPVARAPFDGPALRTGNTSARAPFDGPALRNRNKGKNPFSLF